MSNAYIFMMNIQFDRVFLNVFRTLAINKNWRGIVKITLNGNPNFRQNKEWSQHFDESIPKQENIHRKCFNEPNRMIGSNNSNPAYETKCRETETKWPYQLVALAIVRPMTEKNVYNTSVSIIIYYFCVWCNYLSTQQWNTNSRSESANIATELLCSWRKKTKRQSVGYFANGTYNNIKWIDSTSSCFKTYTNVSREPMSTDKRNAITQRKLVGTCATTYTP